MDDICMASAHSSTKTEVSAIGILSSAPILGNGYFRTLADGNMAKAEFVKSQVQFFHAVGFFSRNLATLAARLPTSAGRAVLVHNLSEEHGFDEENPAEGFRLQFAHDRTFARFLKTLGVDDSASGDAGPPVRAFNLALLGACASESPGFALAALGMIEYAFADISALIGKRVVELGWVKSDELVHYSLHAEIDKRHAAELFEAAEQMGETETSLLGGLAFGRYIFDRLYMDLNHTVK
jgi:pyrroloquinoline-quinone synthase